LVAASDAGKAELIEYLWSKIELFDSRILKWAAARRRAETHNRNDRNMEANRKTSSL
jgi:hypothetical protein